MRRGRVRIAALKSKTSADEDLPEADLSVQCTWPGTKVGVSKEPLKQIGRISSRFAWFMTWLIFAFFIFFIFIFSFSEFLCANLQANWCNQSCDIVPSSSRWPAENSRKAVLWTILISQEPLPHPRHIPTCSLTMPCPVSSIAFFRGELNVGVRRQQHLPPPTSDVSRPA